MSEGYAVVRYGDPRPLDAAGLWPEGRPGLRCPFELRAVVLDGAPPRQPRPMPPLRTGFFVRRSFRILCWYPWLLVLGRFTCFLATGLHGGCHPPAFLWPRYSYAQVFARFLNDQSGATAIEYGLIAAGISIAIITVVNGLGTNLNNKFTSINSWLK